MKALFAIAVLCSSIAAAAEQARIITVTGEGSVQVAPDQAQVQYQFIDQSRTAVGRAQAGKPRENVAPEIVPQLVAKNKARVAPAVEYLKQVVGKDGSVEVSPRVQREYEYDDKAQRQVVVGYRVVSSVQVKLQGRGPIEAKLGELFDTARIGADEMGEPVMSLTETTQASTEKEATRLAVKEAVASAEAQLEAGEKLGAALQRGERIEVPSPRGFASARAFAEAAPAEVDGQAIVETGKVTVRSMIQFVFEVLGMPLRVGAAAAELPKS